MKEFVLILSVVMNGGNEMGGSSLVVPEPFATMDECRAAAKAFTDADGSWNNHRAACYSRTVTDARR